MAATDTPAGRTRPRRVWSVVLWGLQGLLAALLAYAGANELPVPRPEVAEVFGGIGLGDWLQYARGAVELVGAVGSAVPGLGRFAALWFTAVAAGAVVAHLTRLPPAALALPPAVIGGLVALIARR
jgi:hypothetical protein